MVMMIYKIYYLQPWWKPNFDLINLMNLRWGWDLGLDPMLGASGALRKLQMEYQDWISTPNPPSNSNAFLRNFSNGFMGTALGPHLLKANPYSLAYLSWHHQILNFSLATDVETIRRHCIPEMNKTKQSPNHQPIAVPSHQSHRSNIFHRNARSSHIYQSTFQEFLRWCIVPAPQQLSSHRRILVI